MSADSFSRLFRQSAWARFDSKLRRVYQPTSLEPPSNTAVVARPSSVSSRPAHFGFKKDLPKSFFGENPASVIMKDLDGDFGESVFKIATEEAKIFKVVKELQVAMESRHRVPARLLNKTKHDGFAIGIGGLIGRLAAEDVPEGYRFTFQDCIQRRAYWMWVKTIVVEGKNQRPFVTFTLKEPAAPGTLTRYALK
jgi:hypothetical protein